jgi:predicted nucleic acid-binding protein
MIFMISLDSSIFLYSFDHRDPIKQKVAAQWVLASTQGRFVLATQVLGEVFRKLQTDTRFGVPAWNAVQLMLQTHRVEAATQQTFEAALLLSTQSRRQFWDCLIIATCAEHGVKTLYTEDTAGQPHTVMGVKLVNPFA